MAKRTILYTFFSLFTFFSVLAQPIQFEENLINIGLGYTSTPYNSYKYSRPALTLSYERGLTGKFGIGYISAGLLASFCSVGDEYIANDVTYYDNYNYTTIVARVLYHFDMAEITDKVNWHRFNIYTGIAFGFTNRQAIFDEINKKEGENFVASDIFIGGRYVFYENLAAFIEVGYGVTLVNGGLSIKF